MTLYTLEEAAKILRISPKTMRDYCRADRIPSVKIGNKYRIQSVIIDEIVMGEREIERKKSK